MTSFLGVRQRHHQNLPKHLSLPSPPRSFHFPLPNSFRSFSHHRNFTSHIFGEGLGPRVRAAWPQPGRIAHLLSYNKPQSPTLNPVRVRTKKDKHEKSEMESRVVPTLQLYLPWLAPAEQDRITITTTNFALSRMHKFSQKS